MPQSSPLTPAEIRRAEHVRDLVRTGGLRTLRDRVGLSRAAMARYFGLPDDTVKSWERNQKSVPRLDTALRIAPAIAELEELAAEDAPSA